MTRASRRLNAREYSAGFESCPQEVHKCWLVERRIALSARSVPENWARCPSGVDDHPLAYRQIGWRRSGVAHGAASSSTATELPVTPVNDASCGKPGTDERDGC